LFILFMVSSGIAINHTTGLGFDQRHVSNPYLLKLYGIKAPDDIRSFRVGDAWLSFAGSRLYFNEAAVTEVPDGIGAVANDHWVIVAGREELLLLDQQARLVERISWQQAGEIELIGLSGDGRLAVKSTGGLWLADAELLAWQRAMVITGSSTYCTATVHCPTLPGRWTECGALVTGRSQRPYIWPTGCTGIRSAGAGHCLPGAQRPGTVGQEPAQW
jgi:hypothetical protein